MVSFRNKCLKKERRRQEEVKVMMKGMVWVIIFSFSASLLLVKGFFVLQPYLIELVMSPFRSSPNPNLKEDLDIGLFKKLYLQSYPVLFPSADRDIILDSLANRTQFLCSSDQNLNSESSDEDNSTSFKCINAPLCEVAVEDDASKEFGLNVERNILAIPEVQEAIQIPRLYHSFTNELVQISNMTTPIQMILSEFYPTTPRPTFQQLPQFWELLIHGRKKWYFYKPGHFPIEGYDPKSSLQDWLYDVLPSIPAAHLPMEMIQEEGQVIYIPEGWFQASLPLPHPQGESAFLHPLLSSIRHSTNHPGVCTTPTLSHDKLRHEPDSILTLSLRQRALEPEVNSSIFYRIGRATEAINKKEYTQAIEILRDISMTMTDFSSTYLLGRALLGLIEEKLSHSHRREEVNKELIEEAERAFKRAMSLNRLNVNPHVSLIELLLKLKRYSDAETALKAAILLGFTDHEELASYKYIFNIGH